MKINQLLVPWKGDKRFTAISKRAAALKKSGHAADAIVAAIVTEFGAPASLARLSDEPQPFRVYGEVGSDIDRSAVAQLELALRLPVAVKGALMPDAHPGYALPIGGVVAMHRAVSPAMVGVDIGCRMHLTLFDAPPDEVLQRREALFADLRAVTLFGAGAEHRRPVGHPVLEDQRWGITAQTRGLRQKAERQLGTSGSGNHFAELVVGERLSTHQALALPERFCGLLTHSGSRGVGFAIANHYIRVAARETAQQAKVPRLYEWLDLESEAGQEYWSAMELAGAYAQANHEVIHELFLRRSGLQASATIQNHHNFAWRKGDLIIHRKGATPAEEGTLGVIPGSMASESYLVSGLGSTEALESAAHGAGRAGSRADARSRVSITEARRLLLERDVLVEGLSVDEAPQAYKDIRRVMEIQVAAGLVQPLARMFPLAVIMAGEPGDD